MAECAGGVHCVIELVKRGVQSGIQSIQGGVRYARVYREVYSP